MQAVQEAASGYLTVTGTSTRFTNQLEKYSPLAPIVDCMVLSYETGMCKPDSAIYQLTAEKLNVACEDCIFIGDGGSRELYGAAQAGMQPYRAMWYIRQMPNPVKEQPGFQMLESPMDVLGAV